MPFSLGSLYSIELKTVGKTYKGPILKKGLANLSTENNNYEKIKINKNKEEDSIYNDIFNEEGEALDEKGYIKQYIHPVDTLYYVGFENTSDKTINMTLKLTGLYEKSTPKLNKINFTANPMTRRVFILNFIEDFKGDTSFIFDTN